MLTSRLLDLSKPHWSEHQIRVAACALALGHDMTIARAFALDTSVWGEERAEEMWSDVEMFALQERIEDAVRSVLAARANGTEGASPGNVL